MTGMVSTGGHVTALAKREFAPALRFGALVVLSLISAMAAHGQPADPLEARLLNAMRLKTPLGERVGSSGETIRAYIKAGYLRAKPERRFDYTDYRVLRRPARLMGHELVVIEEEYPSKYIGCCVSPGVGAIVRVSGDPSRLTRFASENGCTIQKGEDALSDLKSIPGVTPGPGEYLALSCRERDVDASKQ